MKKFSIVELWTHYESQMILLNPRWEDSYTRNTAKASFFSGAMLSLKSLREQYPLFSELVEDPLDEAYREIERELENARKRVMGSN
jgi:hypothetical protein